MTYQTATDDQNTPAANAYREAAKSMFDSFLEGSADGSIEIDATAVVSMGDGEIDGAYVQAWVWVSNEEAELE